MKIVYIAGPYSGKDYLAIDRNIGVAREAAAFLANNGIGFFCPHLNSAHFEVITPDIPEKFWRVMDLIFLDHCEALWIASPEISPGVLAERDYFEKNYPNRPIFQGDRDAILAWAAS